MRVTVVDRRAMACAWGHPGLYRVILHTVEISDRCPVCGGPRGEPRNVPYCEDGEHYSASRWDNPCGHMDRYEDVLREAALQEDRDE